MVEVETVEVAMVDEVMELAPVKVVLPPWMFKVLPLPLRVVLLLTVKVFEPNVKVPVPVVMVLPFRVVAVAVPKDEVAVAVMEVKDGLAERVICVDVPIRTFCPPLMFKLLPTVKDPSVVVPMPPLPDANKPVTSEEPRLMAPLNSWPPEVERTGRATFKEVMVVEPLGPIKNWLMLEEEAKLTMLLLPAAP